MTVRSVIYTRYASAKQKLYSLVLFSPGLRGRTQSKEKRKEKEEEHAIY